MVVKTGGRGPGHVARTPPGPAAAAMTLSGLSTAENSTAGTLIGVLGTVGTTGTPVFALDNNAGGRAALSGANLNRGATALDYATATFFDVTVSVTGVTPVISPTTFRIAVTPLVDTTPNAFSFTDATGVDLSTVSASNSITVSGINAPSAISVTGGEYEKNGSGTWTGSAGTVVNGDTVKVRGTSSASNSTAVNVVLTIGGVSDTYTITTVSLGPFTFTPLSYYDETSVVQTAGAVSQWTDKGPNGIHLVQVTGANQPAWDVTTGRIVFDGVNDVLMSAVADYSSKPALAVFMLMEMTAIVSNHGIMALGPTGGGDIPGPGVLFLYTDTSAALHLYRDSALLVNSILPGVVQRIGSVVNQSGTDAVYINTSSVSTTGEVGSTAFTSSGRFTLGMRWMSGAVGHPTPMKIKRLVTLDFVPSAPQLAEIWAWLTPPATFSFTPLAYYDETSVVQTAGAVSQWTDKGPNGIHLKQATGANQPAWNSGTSWIEFDGVNDFIVADSRNYSAANALCVFARIKIGPNYGGVINLGAPDDYTGGGFSTNSAANGISAYRDGATVCTVMDNADTRFGVVNDRSGAETVYNKDLPYTDALETSNAAFGSAGRLTVGARWNSVHGFGGQCGNLKIKRLVVVDFVPTAGQRDEIWAWLAS